jgi:nucleotide-binding universal stress UspA family protein
MVKKILIANDGSEGAFKALVAALRLAHSHKTEAHMIGVEEIPWMHAGSREEVVSEKEVADRKFAEVVARAEAEAKHHRVKLVSLRLIPCSTAPMARHPRLVPRTPKPLNGPST